MTAAICTATALTIIVVVSIYRHQCPFRLPTKGLLFGERALQEALNETGHEIEKLEARNEVESWQRLTRVLTHEIIVEQTQYVEKG